MVQMEFFDLVKKKKFKTGNFIIKRIKNKRTRKMMRIAFAKSPFTGKKFARILPSK